MVNGHKPLRLAVCLAMASMFLIVFALRAPVLDAATSVRDSKDLGAKDSPIFDRSAEWRCDVESKFLCFENKCRRFNVAQENDDRQVQLMYWMELNFDRYSYSRCDQNGCDSTEVGTSSGAGYTLIEPGGGAFMKIDNENGDFVDVATMGTGVTMSFGVCVPINP